MLVADEAAAGEQNRPVRGGAVGWRTRRRRRCPDGHRLGRDGRQHVVHPVIRPQLPWLEPVEAEGEPERADQRDSGDHPTSTHDDWSE
jgi:hypothetical protein